MTATLLLKPRMERLPTRLTEKTRNWICWPAVRPLSVNEVTLEPVLTLSPQAAAVASFHFTRYSAIGSRPFV